MDDHGRNSSSDQPILYVLDTNVLIHDPNALLNFEEHHVAIPMIVLEELDKLKSGHHSVAAECRQAIRLIDQTLGEASPEEVEQGVPIRRGKNEPKGTLSILMSKRAEPITWLPEHLNDNKIINQLVELQSRRSGSPVVLVTKDINMRLKAKGAGLAHVEDYRSDQLIDDIRLLAKGFQVVPGSFWERVGECDSETHGRDTVHVIDANLLEGVHVNQYLLDEENFFAARVLSHDGNKIRLKDLGRERLMSRKAWGVHPKNIYQGMALDALLDPHIDLVILTGPAGCGKTLLAMAAALELVIEKGIYEKVIVTRNTPEIAESIGFLPGTEEEKMMPWLAAVTDTLEVLHKQDENMSGSLSYIMEKANIQFKSVNFMRGRSIQNTFVLLDECQNLTASQIKTIITRCGEGTKIVCSGNLAQIDSNYLSPVTSGLTYIVERFKDFDGSANIFLNGVVRSRLASFAEENL